jgi:ADP-ribose pyrophosphatase YjhB (NUDIX family)
VDYGESVETAAIREAYEEISLQVQLIEQFHVYSDPNRDSRQHTISIVFIATATGKPIPADDAKKVGVFHLWEFPNPYALITIAFSMIIVVIGIIKFVPHIRPLVKIKNCC